MEFDKSPHKGPYDHEKERIPDREGLRKNVMMDMYYEKLRQHIKDLPLHEKIKFMHKIMKEDYGISGKNH